MSDHNRNVPVIGLVGGIGSGKSHLARTLRESGKVVVVDGDRAGHEVLNKEPVKDQIRERFGNDVFDAEGSVDRRKLSCIVFGPGDAEQTARADLENIVHPHIKELLTRQIDQAQSLKGISAVLLDAAVLLEAGWREFCDAVVFVDAPLDDRRARVLAGRGWSAAELQSREESQLPLETKRKEADYVVQNSRGAGRALAQLEHVLSKVIPRRPAEPGR